MPRDLSNELSGGMPELTRSPEYFDDTDTPPVGPSLSPPPRGKFFSAMVRQTRRLDELHPYTQTLSIADLSSCLRIEEAAFPPHERATKEKFEYRFKAFGELCMGIYTSYEGDDPDSIATIATSNPASSDSPNRKSVLLGHIVATRSTNKTVTDADMAIPSPDTLADSSKRLEGLTVCIHSLAILPDFQNRGLGKTLLKAYLQRISEQCVADRVVLIAREDLVPFYTRFGFKEHGQSGATFGGGGWFDMVLDFNDKSNIKFAALLK